MTVTRAEKEIAALNYLERGWSVIPVGQNKIPYVQWKEFQSRRATPAEVKEWLNRWPDLNLAAVTGAISGLVVVDIDPRHDGNRSWNSIKQAMPITVEVLTGGGGRHIYFKHPGSFVKSRPILPGLEIKGDAASITLPPSVHQSGKPYVWKKRAQLQALPSWLNAAMARPPIDDAQKLWESVTAKKQNLTTIPEGERNLTLTKIAGSLRSQGFSEEKLIQTLSHLNEELCDPPLSEAEVLATAKQIAKYPAGEFDSSPKPYITNESKCFTAKELIESEPPEINWLWEGLLAPGLVTLFSARPKVGKTTVIYHLLREILHD